VPPRFPREIRGAARLEIERRIARDTKAEIEGSVKGFASLARDLKSDSLIAVTLSPKGVSPC
jgi:hypothetical protein